MELLTLWLIVGKKYLIKYNNLSWKKNLNKLGIERTCLNVIKSIYNKSTVDIMHNGETLKLSL